MPQLTLFIDVSTGNLLTALNRAEVADVSKLPFYYPDTLQLQIYLMTPLQTQQPSQSNYAIVSTAGLALELEFSDGKADNDRTVYASQYVWNTDPNNTYFYANVALGTPAMQTLVKLTEPNNAQCWLKICYIGAGGQADVFSEQVQIGIGIGAPVLIVPAGQTPLSQEVADQRYYPMAGKAGRPVTYVSPLGKIIQQFAQDNPDGTASLVTRNLN